MIGNTENQRPTALEAMRGIGKIDRNLQGAFVKFARALTNNLPRYSELRAEAKCVFFWSVTLK